MNYKQAFLEKIVKMKQTYKIGICEDSTYEDTKSILEYVVAVLGKIASYSRSVYGVFQILIIKKCL